MTKKFFWLLFMVWAVLELVTQYQKLSDTRVHLVFCDVGQGDATLIYQGQAQILIDGGPDASVLTCLAHHLPWFDRQIELVINSHPEQDHLGGLPLVFERYKVGTFVTTGAAGVNKTFPSLAKLIASQNTPIYIASQGDRLKLGELDFQVIWPEKQPQMTGRVSSLGELSEAKDGLNKLSVGLLFHYKSFSFLTMGDVGDAEELAVTRCHLLSKIDVLKVAHHGSKFSSDPDFLALVRPALAVIEVGKNNRYGHPAKETLMHLEALGARIRRTDRDGEVKIETTGLGFKID
jgi:competence protein ComEC